MILTGARIASERALANITLDPFSPDQLNPNSYNYRLGSQYVEIEADRQLDARGALEYARPLPIPPDGLLIEPGKLYLANTLEIIGSRKFVTSLIGRSSTGRLGLFLQIAADLGHQNQTHRWTLEIRSCLPVRIYSGMVIGQVSFWSTRGAEFERPGYYGRLNEPTPSIGTS